MFFYSLVVANVITLVVFSYGAMLEIKIATSKSRSCLVENLEVILLKVLSVVEKKYVVKQ